MSLRRTVPVAVPSLIHNSAPRVQATPSTPVKNSLLLMGVRLLAPIFLSKDVPPGVPSVLQRLSSFTPALTPSTKNTDPFMALKLMSSRGVFRDLTNVVPVAVPSLFQSHIPLTGSSVRK